MISFLIAVCAALFAVPCFAAGPLLTDAHQPMHWGTERVQYTVDPGSLGSLTSFKASEFVKEAFAVWEDVDTATIRFRHSGYLNVDVTADNVLEFFAFAENNQINLIIFDDDGAILDLLLGKDSARTTLGLSQPTAAANGRMEYAWCIFNGRFVGRNGFSPEAYFTTVIHELGHFVGLDHSQLFRHLVSNRYGPDDRYIPVLYPVTTDDETQRGRLTMDDSVSLSMTYPKSSFSELYGEIHGKVLSEGGRSFPGVNVAARKVDDPLAVATTCVSDYLRRGNGSYRLAGLPPGDYILWVEPIDPDFYGRSQVGPYAETGSGLSFARVAQAEFYNGERETFDASLDNRSEAVTVTVKAGEIVQDIDFRVNRDPSPGAERSTQILASGQPETGAVEGRPGYRVMENSQFVFVVSEKDDLMRVEVDTEPMARIQVHIRHEAPVEFENYDARGEGLGHAEVRRSRDSTPPLETGRYFIAVANSAGRTIPYTITVHTIRYPEGDLNHDGLVDNLDLYHFSAYWGQTVPDSGARADLARDGASRIDETDLRQLIKLLVHR